MISDKVKELKEKDPALYNEMVDYVLEKFLNALVKHPEERTMFLIMFDKLVEQEEYINALKNTEE